MQNKAIRVMVIVLPFVAMLFEGLGDACAV